MIRILILYATSHGQTRLVAQRIADRLRSYDLRVQMADFHRDDPPEVSDFDIAVFGSRVHFGRLDARVRTYIARHRTALATIPAYVFSVGMGASTPAGAQVAHDALARWCRALAWTPRAIAVFAGGLPYRAYRPVLRYLVRLASRRAGHPTDTTRDHVLTDFAAVSAFADAIAHAAGLAAPGAS